MNYRSDFMQSIDFREMEASQSHMNWGSGSNTLENSTTMFAADCNVPADYYQQLLGDEDLDLTSIPPYTGECSANVLGDQEQLALEGAWERVLPPSEQMPLPPLQPSRHQPWAPTQELQCPLTSQTEPVEFPTVDQAEESHDAGGEHASRQDDQSPEPVEWSGECSNDHIREATSPPVLPSGESIGVTFVPKSKDWESHLWIEDYQLRNRKTKGVQIYLGTYATEEEAKVAHDRAAIKLRLPANARGKPYSLNFPAADQASYMEEHAQWTDHDFVWKLRRTSKKFSRGKSSMKGVTVRKKSVKRGQEWVTKYESKLSFTAKEFKDDMKQTFMLGNFESEEEAGKAYDRATLFLHQHMPQVEQLRYITNFKPSSYSAAEIEAMASKLPRFQ